MPKSNESAPASDKKLTILRETVVNLRKLRTGIRTGLLRTSCPTSCYIVTCGDTRYG